MLLYRVALVAAAFSVCATAGVIVAHAATAVSTRSDGSLEIDGRKLQCGSARSKLDSRLPNLGLSIPDEGLLIFNPALLRRQPKIVRVFVFHHECGHQHVGGSEMGADCWAVNRGVADGWLDKKSLTQICRSFGNGPDTSTHPSGARRCANLDRCFTVAMASLARQKRVAAASVPAASRPPPQLVSGPILVRTGFVR